ncbi:MAG: TlyA family RNA methyltransferase [candidate division WOR-3 bacterium]
MGKKSFRERLDVLLVSRGLVESRQKAQALIMEGKVRVNSLVVTKPGTYVPLDACVELIEGPKYVSRGGIKLEHAIRFFNIKVGGKVCMDVGASTGGFTHCLLLEGASKVYAVDVGYGLIHPILRNDPRVVVIEKANFRYLERKLIEDEIDIITVDVSFISLEKIIPKVKEFLKANGEAILLVKPQFEVGRAKVSKGGIVRDENARMEALIKVQNIAITHGFRVIGYTESPIRGAKGNIEYLLYIIKS